MFGRIGNRMVGVMSAALVLAACGKKDDAASSESAVAAGVDSMAMSSPAADTAKSAPLTDANIVAILDGANMTDSAAGAVAAKKGTHTEVKDFARMMMRDHHALRKSGQELAKKLNVTPEAPAGDESAAKASAWLDTLNANAKGAAWDKAYIDHEVTYHQWLLATATAAAGAAQNAELKAFIEKAAPSVQAHLTKAQSIQTKLGATASSAQP